MCLNGNGRLLLRIPIGTPLILIFSCFSQSLPKNSETLSDVRRRQFLLHFFQFTHTHTHTHIYIYVYGPGSSVGIATRYGLGGPGIESWGDRDFPHPSRPTLGPTQPSIQWEQIGRAWRWLLTPSSAGGKERLERYLYSLYGPSWPVLGWTKQIYVHVCVCVCV